MDPLSTPPLGMTSTPLFLSEVDPRGREITDGGFSRRFDDGTT